MKKFINNIKKYKGYMLYATKATLKSEVAGSRLNWLWWILDPFLFMLVYTFVAEIVFGKSEKYFPLFVFIGLNLWNFFSKTVLTSVRTVNKNKGMISKVYIPKYILILITMMVNFFKMCVAFTLVIIMVPLYRVPITWRILEIIPLFLALGVFTFGCSCIVLHFGVYLMDLANIVNVALRLMFYMSGIFYKVQKRVPKPYNLLMLDINPVANIIQGARNCILYHSHPMYGVAGIWFVISILLSVLGVQLIVKHENSYVKVS